MVWIHGGGNTLGQGGTYDGSVLAATQQVVVVTFNYRLSVFGWFYTQALSTSSGTPDDRSGNYGTLDQIRALQWVRTNISAFGGDPKRVTVFGESSGAWDVFSLLLAPAAGGLFHRAVIESGGDMTTSIAEAEHLTDDPEPGLSKSSGEVLLRLLIDDRLAEDRTTAKREVARWRTEKISEYLHQKTFADFARVYDELGKDGVQRGMSVGFPTLIRDGHVLPAGAVSELIRHGHYNRVPVIMGTNKDEYSIFLITPAFVRTDSSGIHILDKARYQLAEQFLSELWKADGVDGLANLISHQPGTVFTYRFDWAELSPAPWLDGLQIGASHGLDVPFVFGHRHLGPEFIQLGLFNAAASESYNALSAAMMSYWSQFALTGDPGTGRASELPRWQPWDVSEHSGSLLLNSTGHGGIHMSHVIVEKKDLVNSFVEGARFGSREDRCRLLEDIVPIQGGSHLLTGRMGGFFKPHETAELELRVCK
jgi:para-nitrobenzyl esterase